MKILPLLTFTLFLALVAGCTQATPTLTPAGLVGQNTQVPSSGAGNADEARLVLRAEPVDNNGYNVRLSADIVGGPDNNRDLYCQSVHLDFGDGMTYVVFPDCPDWTPEVKISRHFEQTHTYAPGTYKVTFETGPLKTAITVEIPLSGTVPPDIVFEMKDRYQLGEPIEVRIRNQSKTATYYYQSAFPACYNLKFFDSSTERRPYPPSTLTPQERLLLPGQFIVPRGTHCDTIYENQLKPGEAVVLLTWSQDICIKDRWGCVESVQVSRGEYRIVGEFAQSSRVIGPGPGYSRDGAKIVVAEWRFVIE